MRNPAKAILVALLIAIPAPLVLALLLSFTPEPLRLIAVGEFVEALGSTRGIAAYIITFIVFGIAGFLAVTFSAKQQTARSTSQRGSSPSRSQSSNQSSGQNYIDEDDGYDDNSPEGDEEGTVKWFNVKKGFGFIVRESGDEVFVHFRAIRGSGRRVLRQGQLVRFSVVDADKGLQADNVSILSE
ncbi:MULTISPECIES: cold-shock protein [unclassified Marinobacter]|uniref:cold-shock protein n=1 Tax=unclassified Marinobacter TaxID=83889 RepID=UPI0026E3370A|nr:MULTISPECIES: cold-shock protein [unclassified Marinobacter]MDO6440861.1 cold-shock protein [Marinobacter sp. 2_MG-2023]MDO6823689.1 cold-shock protein [Marinobacter sp. 1_MG-2023]